MKEIYTIELDFLTCTVNEASKDMLCTYCLGDIHKNEYVGTTNMTNNMYCLKCDLKGWYDEGVNKSGKKCIEAWKKYKRMKRLEEI